ncbi:MAG: prepilin peptidase [Gammaproteobacteria bacterium]|nr:prepilin peptidase [Gammaproteobacteria bacterium]MBT4608297.1 prepilin peptidase [Thiotrichales bacterium]MBT3471716.1 prepilin peptidase [Gammaproteobacteria bacterium]MBT3966845.1 prepilin peptidase [Gammaproteobacteria bacterium]MBT4079738.1 prepilin peptidase [Gammaproteobacteria bacterium]
MEIYTLLQQPTPFLIFSMLMGAIIGSFLTMLVHRLPRIMEREWHSECQQLLTPETTQEITQEAIEESLAFPGSYCPHCNHPLRWIDNLPILGFLLNRGRCHHCDTAIHWRYLLLELMSVAVATSTALLLGPGLQAVAVMLFSWVLLALLFIDLEHQLLPDSLTYLLLWSGLLFNQLQLFTTPSSALWGAVAGYLSLWSVFHIYRLLTGKIGMGRGDFKLFAALGAWCGWAVLPQILLIASFSGILIALPLLLLKQRPSSSPILTTAIPFGPFLAIGGWITVTWGDLLNPWILGLAFSSGQG